MDETQKIIQKANSLLLLIPANPRFDQVAAALAFYASAKESVNGTENKKDITISCPTPMLVEFNRLINVDRVTQNPATKNLIISLTNYPPENIERVKYDIIDNTSQLAVIPKTGIQPPQQKQIDFNYSGIAAEVVILFGGRGENDFPALSKKEELAGAKIIHLGVHAIEIPDSISLASQSSSVSEVTYNILKNLDFPTPGDIATNLLMGIESATNNFTSRYVTAETFDTVADLLRAGGQRLPVSYRPQPARPPQDRSSSRTEEVESKEASPTGSQEGKETPPSDWFRPKIYKGKTIS